MKRLMIIIALTLCGFFSANVLAATPLSINYQGRLLETNGVPVCRNVRVDIAIYTNAVLGDPVYTELISTSVPVQNGMYSFVFGNESVSLIDALSHSEAWLAVSIDSVPLSPRQRLVSVPYAVTAHTLDGFHASEFVTTNQLAQGIVLDHTMVAERAVTADAITGSQLTNSAGKVVATWTGLGFNGFAIPLDHTAPADVAIGTDVVTFVKSGAGVTNVSILAGEAATSSKTYFNFLMSGNPGGGTKAVIMEENGQVNTYGAVVKNAGEPVAATDLATKNYVDGHTPAGKTITSDIIDRDNKTHRLTFVNGILTNWSVDGSELQ